MSHFSTYRSSLITTRTANSRAACKQQQGQGWGQLSPAGSTGAGFDSQGREDTAHLSSTGSSHSSPPPQQHPSHSNQKRFFLGFLGCGFEMIGQKEKNPLSHASMWICQTRSLGTGSALCRSWEHSSITPSEGKLPSHEVCAFPVPSTPPTKVRPRTHLFSGVNLQTEHRPSPQHSATTTALKVPKSISASAHGAAGDAKLAGKGQGQLQHPALHTQLHPPDTCQPPSSSLLRR